MKYYIIEFIGKIATNNLDQLFSSWIFCDRSRVTNASNPASAAWQKTSQSGVDFFDREGSK